MMFVLPEAAHLCDRLADKSDADKIDVVVRVASIGNKVALALVVALGFYFGIPVIEKYWQVFLNLLSMLWTL